jgi:hypothetical protein
MSRTGLRPLCGALSTLLLALAPGAAPAEAQSITSPYRFIDGRHEASAFVAHVPGNPGTMKLGPDGGLLTGVRYSLDVGGGPFALEFGGFVLPTERRIRFPGADGTISDSLGVADALLVALETRIRFTLTGPRTWHRTAPFLAMGGGFVGNSSGRTEAERELPENVVASFGPSFLGLLGAGTRVFLTDQLVLRLEATAYYWKVGTPEGFRVLDEEQVGPIVDQEWPSVPAFSVGLSWRF